MHPDALGSFFQFCLGASTTNKRNELKCYLQLIFVNRVRYQAPAIATLERKLIELVTVQ